MTKPKTEIRERDIEKYLCARVKDAGGYTRKMSWVGHNGAPDRFVMLGWGKPLFVELKAPGKKPSPHQEREIRLMRVKGCTVVVLDSLHAVDEFVARYRFG